MNAETEIVLAAISDLSLVFSTRLDEMKKLMETPRLYKIPEAARILNVSPHLLRQACKANHISCAPVNPESKNIQYLIDISLVRQELIECGYLLAEFEERENRRPAIPKKQHIL